MPATIDTRQKILDHLSGKTTWTLPASLDIGLSSTAPNFDGTGVTEPAGAGYSRVNVVAADWTAATSVVPTEIENVNPVNFPAASGGNWGTMSYIVVYEGATLRFYEPLDASVTINDGDDYTIPAGDLKIRY